MIEIIYGIYDEVVIRVPFQLLRQKTAEGGYLQCRKLNHKHCRHYKIVNGYQLYPKIYENAYLLYCLSTYKYNLPDILLLRRFIIKI